MTYYSHTSDVYASFYINVITSNLRDSTYVLDGLLYHEADINIYEHYTDTAGFSDHVFATVPSVQLLAENPAYPPINITPEMDFQVWSVVTFVIHRP